MKIKDRVSIVLVFFLILASSGCGKGIGGGPALTLNPVATSSTGTPISLMSMPLHAPDLAEWLKPGSKSLFPLTGVSGQGQATPTSLSYAISQIRICNSLSTSGTAYNNPSGCSTVYSVSYSQSDYDNNNVTAPYLNMLDMATVKSTINQGAAVSAGTYEFAVIDWFKPIRTKGCINLTSGTLCTRADGTQTASSDPNQPTGYLDIPDLDTASTAEEATFILSNGGSWFKFAKPWVYNGNDAVVLDLAFNPDQLMKGSSACSNCPIRNGVSGPGIMMPYLSMTPVPRTASQTTMKEVYTISHSSAMKADVRMEIYYVKEDPDKTVRGVELRTVFNGTTNSLYMDPMKAFKVEESGTTVSLQDYQGNTMVEFTRLTAEGQSSPGSVTIGCPTSGSPNGWPCTSSSGSTTVDLTLTKIVTVQ